MTKQLKPVAYEYKGKLFYIEDDAVKLNPIYCFVRQSDALAVIAELESAWQVETMVRKDAIIEKQERHNDELKARIKALESENSRLRKDKDRLDWLADVDNNIGGVYLPNDCVMQNIADMRDAIDMAMDMYKNKPKIDTSSERVDSVTIEDLTEQLCTDDPTLAAKIEEAAKTITADDVATCFVRVDCDGSHHSENTLDMVDWPEDDNRIDTIGQNGNTGAHYE